MIRAVCRESQSLVAFAMLDEGSGSKIVTGSVSCGAPLLRFLCKYPVRCSPSMH